MDVSSVFLAGGILAGLLIFWYWRAKKVKCVYCQRLGKKIALHEEGGEDGGPVLSYECPTCGPRSVEL